MRSNHTGRRAGNRSTKITVLEYLRPYCVYTLATLAFLGAAQFGRAQSTPLADGEVRRRANALLQQMTVEEKAGQLNQSSGVDIEGFIKKTPDSDIQQGRVGSILWLVDVKEINRLQHIAVEQSGLHIPLLIGFDVIHGYRMVFPVPLAMASSWDPSV